MLLSYLYPVRNSPEKRTWKMILSQNAWKTRNEHFLEKTKDLPSLQVIGVPSWCVQQNTSGQMCHNSFDYYDNLSGWRQKQIDKCVRFKSKIHPVCKSQEQIELDLLIFQRTQHNATSRKKFRNSVFNLCLGKDKFKEPYLVFSLISVIHWTSVLSLRVQILYVLVGE